ncbi:hypothetical protein Goari_015628 [Gossypium aridum]|uniref:Uncharacterized protein n=1 Tax=Gossypium aridum TaxID=34290 RepID=A0A7J8WG47_GOSAI|nr:hypothetical protein [Gossypium aridum]
MGLGKHGWFNVKKQIKGGNRWGDERTKWWLAGGLQNDNRDGNKVVDQLVKVGEDKLDYLVILNDPPHFVRGYQLLVVVTHSLTMGASER